MQTEINKLKNIFKENKDKLLFLDSFTNKEFTYGDVEDYSLRMASFLKKNNVQKNDKIAVLLPNCIEFMMIYFGCMQIGAIPVPINQKLHPDEIKHIISNSGVKLLFVSESYKKNVHDMKQSIEKVISLIPSSENKKYDFLESLRNIEKQKESFSNIDDDDTIIIVYTSGTTNKPKGVMLPYKTLIKNGSEFIKKVGIQEGLRFYGIMSHAYLGGFYNLMMIPLLAKGSIVIEDAFNPTIALNFWEKIKKYDVSALWIVPSMISIILSVDRSDVGMEYCENGKIKLGLVGTAPLPAQLKKSFEDKYKINLYENYGLSETLFIATNSILNKKNEGVGTLMPTCHIEIVDNDGNSVQSGERGEIIVHSDYKMKGYHNNKEETDAVMEEDTFHTGDVGYLDKEGYLFITDRKKDIIIRGGINLSPKEIEDCIMKSKLAKEVSVVGIPNKLLGEEVIAVIIPNEKYTEKKISDFCQTNLTSFKIPSKYIIVKDFPRSVTGKIQKNVLRKQLSI